MTRVGFLQSKGICNEAEVQEIRLTPNVSVKYDNIFWVKDINLYDDKVTKLFVEKFREAFEEDKDWALKIFDEFEQIVLEVKDFIGKINDMDKIKAFKMYVKLLKAVQKYYVIAVPLTDYCEKQLSKEVIEDYAVPYKELEMGKAFPWIKTAYNIIQEVDEKNFEVKEKKEVEKPEIDNHFVTALQVGIYLRNRMKELSQQLWYYIEPVAQKIAKELGVERDDFFMLTYNEVINREVSKEEIEKRKQCFVIGILDDKEVLLSGDEAQELFDYYNKEEVSGQVKGTTACKGKVVGKVRIILGPEQFKDFKQGEVLVTTMTTPDFVPIMSKAAAIVTDEGGLSCHAAIVSREMNIPCVIGTKNGSKVLKNGVMVEVDADEGKVIIFINKF